MILRQSDRATLTFGVRLRRSRWPPAMSDEAVAVAMVAEATRLGPLKVAVNNTGIGGNAAPTADVTTEDWRRVLDVNLDAVFFGMRAQIPAMIAAGGGAIVNMSSILGSVGFATSSAYVTSKHGLIGLTKNAALEYGQQGVRVNSVGPAFISTPLVEQHLDETTRGSYHLVGRWLHSPIR